MPARHIVDYPNQTPIWATDIGVTDEPSLTDRKKGHEIGTRSPAKEENWRANLVYEWTRRIPATAAMNWKISTAVGGGSRDFISIIFNPDKGRWLTMHQTALDHQEWASYDGYTWAQVAALNTLPSGWIDASAVDDRFYLLAMLDNRIAYSGGLATWTYVTAATIGGGAHVITAMTTKYPNSRYVVVSKGDGTNLTVSRASEVNLSWTVASTPPPSVPSGAWGRYMIHAGPTGNTFLLLTNGTNTTLNGDRTRLYKSTDNGANWAQVTGMSQFPSASSGALCMAYNEGAGRLVVAGSIATSGDEEYFGYSDDLGDTWTASTINKNGLDLNEKIRDVYYLGGDTWVAIPFTWDVSLGNSLYVSNDNAETWRIADVGSTAHAGENYLAIGCNGSKLVAIGTGGAIIHSLSS